MEHCEQGWRWAFAAAAGLWGTGLDVASKWYGTEAEATEALAALRRALYPPEQAEPRPDPSRLRFLRDAIESWDSLASLQSKSSKLLFARDRLGDLARHESCSSLFLGGLQNLGNTCYINAVLQCLFHTAPFRSDLMRQARGASHMGDRLSCHADCFHFCFLSSPLIRTHNNTDTQTRKHANTQTHKRTNTHTRKQQENKHANM